MRSNTGLVLVAALAVAFAFAACGGSAARDDKGGAGATGNDAAGAPGHADAGASGATEVGGAGGAAGVGALESSCLEKHDEQPGPALYELSTPGSGACAGRTLADAIAQVRALRPDLADITDLYQANPEPAGDGSFVHAFAKADGGFALAFKRGAGDCPAGCTVNDYWYFETDSACQVAQVGESHPQDSCTLPDQLPRWGIPPAAAPRDICGADNSPVELSGTYDLVACGSDSGCALAGEKPPNRTLPSVISLKIEQDPSDLSQGTVTLDGTGEGLLDEQPLAATFDRQSFAVHLNDSNVPTACTETRQIDLTYDFEGYGPRHLRLFQVGTPPDCTNTSGAYCKGELDADLGKAHLQE